MVKRVVNFFGFAFLADGLVSFLDDIVGVRFGFHGLSAFRQLVAALVLLMSLPVAGVLIFSARTPKRMVIPMILFLWWDDLCEGFPLQAWHSPWKTSVLAALQVALALGMLLSFRSQGAPWHSPFLVDERRLGFRWKHTVLTGLGMGTALLAGLLVAAAFDLASTIESATGGYVRLKPDGLYIMERKFRQGDHEVWLIGMVHIARHEFYQNVLPPADPKVPSVVLAEGVTDRKKLLKGPIGYARLAKMLHLDSQEDCEYQEKVRDGLAAQEGESPQASKVPPRARHPRQEGLDFKRADIDVESFSPETIAILLAVMRVIRSENLQQMQAFLKDRQSPLRDKAALSRAKEEILYSRNDKLVSEIDSSLKGYQRVLVPWGAAHLPGTQTWLIAHGFIQQGEVERKAIAFW